MSRKCLQNIFGMTVHSNTQPVFSSKTIEHWSDTATFCIQAESVMSSWKWGCSITNTDCSKVCWENEAMIATILAQQRVWKVLMLLRRGCHVSDGAAWCFRVTMYQCPAWQRPRWDQDCLVYLQSLRSKQKYSSVNFDTKYYTVFWYKIYFLFRRWDKQTKFTVMWPLLSSFPDAAVKFN